MREYAGRLLRVFRKRFSDEGPPRIVLESLADELVRYLEEVEAQTRGKRFKRGEPPPWATMSDRELGRALRSLIDVGAMPVEGEEDAWSPWTRRAATANGSAASRSPTWRSASRPSSAECATAAPASGSCASG